MSDRPVRAWRCYLRDMIDFGEKVVAYTAGMDKSAFLDDGLVYDATIRNLELIGEAAGRIPSEIRESHEAIPWRDIVAMRNRLAHGYTGVDDATVWRVIENEIPDLLAALRDLSAKTQGP